MKKFLSFVVAFCLMFSVCTFAGCTKADNQDLLDRITALEKMLENAGNNDTQALLAQIAELEKQLENAGSDSGLATDVATLKTTVATLQTTVATMNDTITLLNNVIKDSTTGNAALQAKIDKLVTDVATLTAEIAELQTAVTGFEIRIAILESLQMGTTEQHIYTVCEDAAEGQPIADNTYTFVNNSTGAKLFSVKLTEFVLNPTTKTLWLTIYNHSIPSNVPSDTYFTIYSYDENTKTYYRYINNKGFSINFGDKKTIGFDFSVDTSSNTSTHFILGIPTQDPNKQSMIPYATFKL